MAILDDLRNHGPAVAPLLAAGERLLALSAVRLAHGVHRQPAPTDPGAGLAGQAVAAVRRLAEPTPGAGTSTGLGWAVAAALTVGPSLPAGTGWLRRLGGTVSQAQPDSTGWQLHRLLAGSGRYLAVTDQRLLLCQLLGVDRMSLLGALERTEVTGALASPRAWARGRLQLRFADASWTTLGTWPPHLGGGHARRLAAALD